MPRKDLTREVLEGGEVFIPGQREREELFFQPMVRPEEYDIAVHANYFWPDATPRATAMEFQGTVLSACFERGKMTCLSCHSMHASDPADQLRFPEDPATAVHESDQQCLQCHERFAPEAARAEHTRHAADSAGSRCIACHMPYQSYGLLQAQRSHRIQSPDPVTTARHALPNACNQCHVDRSLRWTAQVLDEWRGRGPRPAAEDALFAEDRSRVSETLLQLVQGHALSRAIAVQMLGREDGRAASPGAWRVPFLIDALDDPYPTVRQNAYRALRREPGFEDAAYVYFADREQRGEQIAALRERWLARLREHVPAVPDAVPLGPDGLPDALVIGRLRAERDELQLNIAE
jgi:hypothetical protein